MSKWWTPSEEESLIFELEDLVGKDKTEAVLEWLERFRELDYIEGYQDGLEAR